MREERKFNENWKFHEGDDPAVYPVTKHFMYHGAKTESRIYGFAAREYGDKKWGDTLRWDTVTLPHDYLIGHDSDPEGNETLGFFRYDNGCYIKKFDMPAEERGKRITVYFEGVASSCAVYLNGCFLGENHSAYNSFEYDMTPYLRFGERNTLTVLVGGDAREGWWYAGAGIVRDVWLCKTDSLSVDRDGLYVMPRQSDADTDTWTVPCEVTLRNDGREECTAELTVTLDGEEKGRGVVTLPPEDVLTVCRPFTVRAPERWDVDSPRLYEVTVTLSRDGATLDERTVKTGFRTAEFLPDGFYLNGRKVFLKGVCCHEDYSITGRAVPYAVKELRLQKLRDLGVNAYRCAHYQQSTDTMELLDELGFLVMAENRHFECAEPYMSYFAQHLRRDRNHPSVVLWSTSNEETYHHRPEGAVIQRRLVSLIRKYDGDRAITCAATNHPARATVWDDCSVVGMNYNTADADETLEKFPDKCVLMSECVACATTRGWYADTDDTLGYFTGYDRKAYVFADSLQYTMELMAARPRMAGCFIWAGAEHRGEAYWPRLFSQAGLLDAALHVKDSGRMLRSYWADTPVMHLMPHWNHAQGQTVRVWAMTNCEEAELFLNGRSLGRVSVAPGGHGEWFVPFAPGELTAVGYINGAQAASDSVRTAGAPVRLELLLENRTPFDSRRTTAVVTCRALDADGVPVPDAALRLLFSVTGGRILGTWAGPCDHRAAVSREREMFMGLCSAAVELPADAAAGECVLTVHSDAAGKAAIRLR